ncbi:D-alanyl-D-alanine carboxypeptidase family protein [Paenibacillus sp. GCM10023252]|uniref:D-alanyl-D-alanine carboxypeptidase family protein n=1 Tax=Paenibacillus sp. GCM10023252 TaxID=3252649 RepID=UPI003621FE76
MAWLCRSLSLLLSTAVAGSLFLSGLPKAAYGAVPAVGTHAQASALIDVESGRLLHSSQGDKQLRIASLTKIMTAIVAIEDGQLTDVVTTSKRAYAREGSSIYLQLGEKMTLLNLLYGLMLRSGNDAATAIAEHVGGSEEGFVQLMNNKAELIGLRHTQFRNPHGLDAEGHYSSANDLARLTAYALRNPIFSDIVRTKVKTAPNPNDEWDYMWHNKNKMLSMYEGADGVKTGYTKLAFRCLVSSATRNGQRLAAVTINDGDDWADHRKLLDWGFQHYPLVSIADKGQAIAAYTLAAGNSFRYPLAESEKGELKSTLILEEAMTTRYKLGYRGSLEWSIGETRIGTVPVYDAGSVRLQLPERRPLTLAALHHSDSPRFFADSLMDAMRALFR